MKAQQLKEPNNSMWSYYLGVVMIHAKDYAIAESALREALKISEYEGRNSEMIYVNLAEILNESGKYAEAMDLMDIALTMDSTYTRIWYDRSDIYYNMGKTMPAIECANKAIESDPDNAFNYYSRARKYMYAKMYRNALDDINTAISLDDKESSYLMQRSEIYKKMGQVAEADADCRTVIERESAKKDDEQDLQSLAYAYARTGNRVDVLSTIEKAYKNRCDRETEYEQTCLYSLIGDKNQALYHLENALQLGFCNFVHIGNDTDLDNIRETEKFKSLINEYKKMYNDGVSVEEVNEGDYIEEVKEVPFQKESGIYKVKCTINDLPLHFYFDTGASDVTISSLEAQFMLKNDYLKITDLKGREYYGTASGEIAEGTIVVLRKIDFGGMELTNVKATVVHNQQAPLLLGQTALSRLGKIEIDYEKNIIKIISRKKK